jgi:hypothetical protein
MARVLTNCKFRFFSLALLLAISSFFSNALEGDFSIASRPKEPTAEHLQELVKSLLAAPPALVNPDVKKVLHPPERPASELFQNTPAAEKLAIAARQDIESWLRLLLPPNVAKAVPKADATVRTRAAWVLGLAADRRALQPLIQSIAYDPDESVREAAGLALPRLEEPVALRMLIDLATASDYTKYPWIIRQNAAHGLIRYGNPAVVERLLRALSYELAAGNPYDPKNRIRGLSYGLGTDNPLMMPTSAPDLKLSQEDLYPVLSALKSVTGKNFETLNKDLQTWLKWWKKSAPTFVLPSLTPLKPTQNEGAK